MKKRILLFLCLILGLSVMAGCASEDYGEVDPAVEAALSEYATTLFEENFQNITDTEEIEDLYEDMLSDGDELMANAYQAWKPLQKELGAFQNIADIEVTRTSEGYKTELTVQYEKRQLNVGIGTNEKIEKGIKLTSLSLEGQYTYGEKMQKAVLNTAMGMGTVFVVLLIIIVVISSFSLINKFQTARENKKAAQTTVAAPAAPAASAAPAPVVEEDLTDDLALVAVITAAIAASENTSPDGLVVRSIRRAGKSSWKHA